MTIISFFYGWHQKKNYDEVKASCSPLISLDFRDSISLHACWIQKLSLLLCFIHTTIDRPFILHALLKLSHVTFFPLILFCWVLWENDMYWFNFLFAKVNPVLGSSFLCFFGSATKAWKNRPKINPNLIFCSIKVALSANYIWWLCS